MAVLHTEDLALLLNELREVTDPHKLGIFLCIDPAQVTIILKNAPGDVERQKSDVLEYWLKNGSDASWPTLVEALKKSDHVRLADRLENEYITTAATRTGGSTEGIKEEEDDNDLEGKRAEILECEESVKREYGNFLCRAGKLMEEKQVKLTDVKVTWSGYDSKMSCDAMEAKDISTFLIAVRGTQGPYRFGNIGGLLTVFCEEDGKQLVAEYEKRLKCKLDPRVVPVHRSGRKFKVKIDEELDQKNIRNFRNTLAKLFECRALDFILEDVRKGCIELVYVIPSDFAEKMQKCILIKEDKDFECVGIVELWIESQLVWKSQRKTSIESEEGTIQLRGEASVKFMEETQDIRSGLHVHVPQPSMAMAMPKLETERRELSTASSGSYGEQPTLSELLRLMTPAIFPPFHHRIHRFGRILLHDSSRMFRIMNQCNNDTEDMVLQILQEWLSERTAPVTWDYLVMALRAADLDPVADEIERKHPY